MEKVIAIPIKDRKNKPISKREEMELQVIGEIKRTGDLKLRDGMESGEYIAYRFYPEMFSVYRRYASNDEYQGQWHIKRKNGKGETEYKPEGAGNPFTHEMDELEEGR